MYSSSGSAFGVFLMMLSIIIFFAVIAAFLTSTGLFIEAAKKKGHYEKSGTGLLWFIGIFATPIVVGLYVNALPDLKSHTDATKKATESELPAV